MSSLRAVGAALTIVIGLAVSGCGSAEDPPSSTGGIEVSGTWVRATTGATDSTMTGAFMEISNSSASSVRLVSASSPAARMVQVHTTVMRDGSMMMEELKDGLEVKAGSHAHLRPGGNHVMLMGLKGPLTAGEEVTLRLVFSDGTSQTLTVPVKEFTEEEDHYDPSMTPSPTSTSMP